MEWFNELPTWVQWLIGLTILAAFLRWVAPVLLLAATAVGVCLMLVIALLADAAQRVWYWIKRKVRK